MISDERIRALKKEQKAARNTKKPTRLDRVEEFGSVAAVAIRGLHDRLAHVEKFISMLTELKGESDEEGEE